MLKALIRGGAVASLVAGATLLAAPTAAQAAPAGVDVQLVTANGSGCAVGAGEATGVTTDDGEFLTVTSPAYFAQAGGAARPTDIRKNCLLSLQIRPPAGWTYAVTEVHSSGYAFLTSGVTGVSRISVWFQGSSVTQTATHTFAGPQAEPWRTVDELPLQFAPCGAQRNLNINTEVRVNRGSSTAATSSFTVRNGETGLRLVWREC